MTTTSQGSLSGVIVEVVNTVILTYVVTEKLLQNRSLRHFVMHIGALLVLNVILSPTMFTAIQALAGTAAPFEVKTTTLEPAFAENRTSVLPDVMQAVGHRFQQPVVRTVFRVICVLSGFLALMYCDVRRMRPPPYTPAMFLHDVNVGFWLVIPVWPFLVIGFSCVFLVVVSVLRKLGLPEDIGEEIIFYGQFYAPLSALYWIVKKEWVDVERSSTPLPTVVKDQ